MGHIFLSYAREDRACAEILAHVLEENGYDVWWDRRIDGGEEFSTEIEAALDKSDVVLVAWSKDSVKSRWVRDEAAAGGDTGRLVPVTIDGTRPPMGFRQFHTMDLTNWKGGKRDRRTAELLHAVERRLSGKQPDEVPGLDATASQRIVGTPKARRLWAFAMALSFFIAAAATYFYISRSRLTPAQPGLIIALLPLTASSADPRIHDIAAQATDSLSHTLPDSGVPVRLLTPGPADAKQEGDFVISGEISMNRTKVIATVRMDRSSHGLTVFTRRFEATGDEISDLPERIGAQIAGTIAWAAPLIELEMRHPSDPSVTADLVRQLDFLGDPLQGYQAAQRAAAKDPKSAFAQVALAFDTAFNLGRLPLAERAQAVADARAASKQAVKLAPEFGDAYSVDCYLHSEALIGRCEDRLRTGRAIDPDSPFLDAFLSEVLRRVGRFDEAGDLAQLSYARDPYVPTKIGWKLRTLESNGESAKAQALNERGVRWWPEFSSNYFENRLLSLLERGDWASIRVLEQATSPDNRPSDYRDSAKITSALHSRSVAGLNSVCAGGNEYWLNLRCLIGYSTVGDLDRAFELAEKLYPKRLGRTPAETERIWLESPDLPAPLELITSPAAEPMRRDPRYLALAQRTGLLAYWRAGRLPDFCGKRSEPICQQLRRHR